MPVSSLYIFKSYHILMKSTTETNISFFYLLIKK